MLGSVFDKARPEDIRTEPFPHLVIEDALEAADLDRLLRTRPAYPGKSLRSNMRLAIPAWMLLSLEFYDPAWKRFAEVHSRPEILYRVHEIFADHWPSSTPTPDREGSRYGLIGRDGYDAADTLLDARLEIISPVEGPPGSHRRGHVDTPNRLFSALFYLRDDEDDSTGGGLELFRYRGPQPAQVDVFELPGEAIEKVVTIPYRANTLVVFPNRPDAIHGAEVRDPTPHERAYVFITAEVEADLF